MPTHQDLQWQGIGRRKNNPVSIIDTQGKTIKLLDKIDGKEVDGVRAFVSGYAVFMTTDSLWGVIDDNGKCVIKPVYYSLNDYGDGKFIGVNVKYKKTFCRGKKTKSRFLFLTHREKQFLTSLRINTKI